jgi:hypothetical protein
MYNVRDGAGKTWEGARRHGKAREGHGRHGARWYVIQIRCREMVGHFPGALKEADLDNGLYSVARIKRWYRQQILRDRTVPFVFFLPAIFGSSCKYPGIETPCPSKMWS